MQFSFTFFTIFLQEAKKLLEAKCAIEIKDLSEIIQDIDVLDTWFSSALIPLALSGWPKSTVMN